MLIFPSATRPDDATADRALFAELVAGERESYRIGKRSRRRDLRTVWGRLTSALVRDGAGRPQAALAMIEDITARVTAERVLRARELRYRAVVEQAAKGLFFFDAATKRLTGANPAFLDPNP